VGSHSALFLFNNRRRCVIGVFVPDGQPGRDISRSAFGGAFPEQVRVQQWEQAPLQSVGMQTLFAHNCCVNGDRVRCCSMRARCLSLADLALMHAPVAAQLLLNLDAAETERLIACMREHGQPFAP
jgi:hypothetical protein